MMLFLIASPIYLLGRRKNIIPYQVRQEAGLLEGTTHLPSSHLGLSCEHLVPDMLGYLKGQGPEGEAGSAVNSKQASWAGSMVGREHYLVRFFVSKALPPMSQLPRITKL